ncbi:radical SAM family heme chaperone HemW [Staphylococcus massiliensis]|uniref:radical SAM family heme chaperone HemW n=1 Tax=Staphylococcus massiliensis TaxID=555791 RepID=UPI000CD02B1F|nr:radical SAM family heme chaperone HemW [Staphylococcus massiliensis]MCG3399027.1 radical SAM family heme chaperone HemW [Staphylococcus massiliensis]PNZ98922.1 coproporphyrinogen III oxidase [Staphylococcus massiliensis CCUG 55927]
MIVMAKSVYIHIPFCVRICTYCDFNKYYIQNQPVDTYLECLKAEMATIPKQTIQTLFVGGGTPTALSMHQLEYLLKAIQNQFKITKEFSFEANPDELTREKVQLLKDYGVNRISMGVQTFEPRLLEILGRTHRTEDIYRSVDDARAVGIPSISLDLMYHLPTQTMNEFGDSLNRSIEMDIDHISSYGLILEPKTQFYNMYRQGKLKLPNQDIGAEMYEYLMHRLVETPFQQYELSNFAKKGHDSIHNQVYWKNDYYYGFGAGASGYVDGERYTNVNPVNHYIKHIKHNERPLLHASRPTLKEQMEEEMFLGLRMNQGVNKDRFYKRYHQTPNDVFGQTIPKYVEKGLLIEDGQNIALTNRGRVIGNEVFEAFLIGD